MADNYPTQIPSRISRASNGLSGAIPDHLLDPQLQSLRPRPLITTPRTHGSPPPNLMPLPDELLILIAEQLDRRDLSALCLVSSRLAAVGQQILLRRILIPTAETDTLRLIRYLLYRPEVGGYIRSLNITAPMEPADSHISLNHTRVPDYAHGARLPFIPYLPVLKELKTVSKNLDARWFNYATLESVTIDCLQHGHLPLIFFPGPASPSIDDMTLIVNDEAFSPRTVNFTTVPTLPLTTFSAMPNFLDAFRSLRHLQVQFKDSRHTYTIRNIRPLPLDMNFLVDRLEPLASHLETLVVECLDDTLRMFYYKAMNKGFGSTLQDFTALKHIVLPPWALLDPSTMLNLTPDARLSNPVHVLPASLQTLTLYHPYAYCCVLDWVEQFLACDDEFPELYKVVLEYRHIPHSVPSEREQHGRYCPISLQARFAALGISLESRCPCSP